MVTDPAKLVVATVTWARTPDEGRTLLSSLARLTECGCQVMVADRGTDLQFLAALRRLAQLQVTVPTEHGLVNQVKASFALASAFEAQFILYVESDKEEFFTQRLGAFLREAPDSPDVGVVLACRSGAAFETFPPTQRYTEGVFNDLCREVIGSSGDYCYGPFLMNRVLLPHIATLKPDLGWGWRPSTFVAAHERGLQVVCLEGDHWCPEDQRDEDKEERKHRLRQLSQNILGLTG